MKTTLYLATAEGLAVVTGSGDHWQGRVALVGTQIQCVAVAAFPEPCIYAGTFGNGALFSEDGGLTWTTASGLENAKVTALTISKNGMPYAGTEPSGVFRSEDKGRSWQKVGPLSSLPSAPTWSFPPRPETNHIQSILADPNRQGHLHVAVEAGALLRTEDGGTTWLDRVPGGPSDTHSLTASPLDSQRLFSAAGDGCFESLDGGQSWRPFAEGLRHIYCWSIAINASHPETMLLSASEHAFAAHSQQAARSFVYRRVGDEPWRLAMDGLSALLQARIPVIAAGPLEPNTFYLASDGHLFRTEDEGSHWRELAVEWHGNSPLTRHSLSMAISQRQW